MRKITSLLAAAAVIATPIAALAKVPSDLSDLIGIRASSLDGEMGNRGYEYIKSEGLTQYWWNGKSNACIWAVTDNGIISSIQSASAGDCGKSSGGSTAAGIAAGAVAIGLIAALTSHHKKDPSRDSAEYNAEYQQGYNDAMYGAHYSKDNSEAYHSGYMAGETERNNRRHSNSTLVKGAPAAAQYACNAKSDEMWGVPKGSSVTVSVFDYGQGNYELTTASGHLRGKCSVNARGVVSDFLPQ